MKIDFHTHIFPSFFIKKRDSFFSGEPAFKLLYDSPKSKMVQAGDLIRMMDEEEIDKSVVFGFPWENTEYYCRHNDYILESVSRYPERLIGFGCFSHLSDNSVSETERCLKAGMSGIGELATYGSGLSSEITLAFCGIMELCARFDVPVLLHTNEPLGHEYPGKCPLTLNQLYNFIKKYPGNKIVLAHWGGGLFFYALMKKEVKDVLKNVWFDTAASPYLYSPDIYKIAIEITDPEKILMGSDYPLLEPQRYLRDMTAAGLNYKTIKQLSGLNAIKLLKL